MCFCIAKLLLNNFRNDLRCIFFFIFIKLYLNDYLSTFRSRLYNFFSFFLLCSRYYKYSNIYQLYTSHNYFQEEVISNNRLFNFTISTTFTLAVATTLKSTTHSLHSFIHDNKAQCIAMCTQSIRDLSFSPKPLHAVTPFPRYFC